MTRNPIADGETVIRHLFSSLMNAHGSEAVLNGLRPTVGTGNWDVDIATGDVFINNATAAASATTVTLTAPSSDPDLDSGEFRVDLLTVDSGGSVNVTEGVAATNPLTEDIPNNEVVVACVIVSGNASSLTSSDIRDYRTILEDDSSRYVDGGPHEIDAQEFAGGDGANEEVLSTDGSDASWANLRAILAGDTNRESGNFTTGGNGDFSTTISFSNSYLTAAVQPAKDDTNSVIANGPYMDGYTTDGNGDIDGAVITGNDDANSQQINWYVSGVLA